MKKTGDYYVVVVEDTNLRQIVATATLITEHKFIHSCVQVNNIYSQIFFKLFTMIPISWCQWYQHISLKHYIQYNKLFSPTFAPLIGFRKVVVHILSNIHSYIYKITSSLIEESDSCLWISLKAYFQEMRTTRVTSRILDHWSSAWVIHLQLYLIRIHPVQCPEEVTY